ncbi:MAG: HAMP domain-containing sensor histidine kinase [Halioglobus sp.]|nr:HAMP domain-containing sensor histidine kinase [Halioglobus sp.]
MSLWQPRSLQQLVLISFFAALAPLCLAILFTVETLGELSEKNRRVTHTVVDATRLGQEIQRDVLELERRARQYLALADLELAQLFKRERDIIMEKLTSLQRIMPTTSPDIGGLRRSLARLSLPRPLTEEEVTAGAAMPRESRLDHDFAVINEQRQAVRTWLDSSVDQLVRQNAVEAESLIDNLILQLSMLAAATLALLLLLAFWINKPVRDLTKEIHQLGTTGLSHSIEISGPLELQALGSELEWLRKSLHESEQQKEQFLRHISHELKTPLASLREGADLLADQVAGRMSQQQLEIVDILRRNSIELQRLIENLLDYNRLPAQELSCEEFNLDALWRELLANYRLSIDKKALYLNTKGAVATWVADRDKLKTSLDNLLSNAINYTPEGGNIDIVWGAHDDELVIDVANSGDPIPTEDAERVFQPFFQSEAKRIGPIKGSGIGLSVAREYIEAQGGTLVLHKHPKLPICFRLTCPAY